MHMFLFLYSASKIHNLIEVDDELISAEVPDKISSLSPSMSNDKKCSNIIFQ